METQNSQPIPGSIDVGLIHDHPNSLPQLSHVNGGGNSDQKLSAEEVKGVLEIIASTGKFWHDWDELKSMLFFQLKQVLLEYPEARISEDQLNSSEDSYQLLIKSLEEALFDFIEGPPFTLQRLCEILLNARTIYPNLSKLALAIEKNLLVTSTLTKSADPYPPSLEQDADALEQVEDAEPLPQPESPPHSNPLENGGEIMIGDRDEVMSEANAETDDGITVDMGTVEEISRSSETSNPPPSNS